MSVYFITGCNRGIGLGLCKEVLKAGHSVIGTCRNPDGERDLWELEQDYHGKLSVVSLDLSDQGGIERLSSQLSERQVIDILVNNAGILEDFSSGIDGFDPELFMRSFEVNTLAPMLVVRALLPFLRKSLAPKIFQISSELGSVAENSSGMGYGYRCSKAALNMATKNLSIELPDIVSVTIHPGWVRTRMGGERAPLSIEESVKGLFSLTETLGLSETGKFYNYTGEVRPW